MGRGTSKRLGGLAAVAVLLAGCGAIIGLDDFDVVGDAGVEDASSPDDVTAGNDARSAPPTDAGADAPIVLPPVTCGADAGACAALGLDAGWSPVAVAAGSATCPDGFGGAVVALTSPVAGPGACDCTVTSKTPPSCDTVKIQFYDGVAANECNDAGGSATLMSGCQNGATNFAQNYASYTATPIDGGASCTAAPVADAGGVTTSPVTLCAPTPACADTVCAKAPLGALRDCIIANGDVACPSGAFSMREVVGSAVSGLTCSSCSCSVSSETCGGSVVIFSASGCAGTVIYDAPPGTCFLENKAGFKSSQYNPTVASATYDAGGPKTASNFTFSAARTLCCAP